MDKIKKSEVERYFAKNKVVCLNSVFQKFGHSVGLIETLRQMASDCRLGGKLIEPCGELTFKVYKFLK